MSEQVKHKAFLRVAQTDLDGSKQIYYALLKIKGISFNLSHAICSALQFNKKKLAGTFTDEEAKKIEDLIKHPKVLPTWLLNRQQDIESGEDRHVVSGDLRFTKEFDIKRLRRLKTYRGVRHSLGQPVRGQRTRSNFRSGKAVGVSKKGAK